MQWEVNENHFVEVSNEAARNSRIVTKRDSGAVRPRKQDRNFRVASESLPLRLSLSLSPRTYVIPKPNFFIKDSITFPRRTFNLRHLVHCT